MIFYYHELTCLMDCSLVGVVTTCMQSVGEGECPINAHHHRAYRHLTSLQVLRDETERTSASAFLHAPRQLCAVGERGVSLSTLSKSLQYCPPPPDATPTDHTPYPTVNGSEFV